MNPISIEKRRNESESIWYKHSKDPENIIAKADSKQGRYIHIHIGANLNEGISINFSHMDCAMELLRFINIANRSNKVLHFSSICSVLDIPVPSPFDNGDRGWLTPVDYTFDTDWKTHVVRLTAPCSLDYVVGRDWKHLEKSKLPEPAVLYDLPYAPFQELPYPDKVIRSGPMTIAVWPDKSKTYVRIKDDDMSQDDPEKALALVTLKKLLGPHKFRKLFKEFLGKK